MSIKQTFLQEIGIILSNRGDKIVLAESCTAGAIAASLGSIPGISRYLCGSAVVYRASTKRKWLGIKKRTIQKFTTESHKMAQQLAINVLCSTPEAIWSLAIVGHLGPDSPLEKDGLLYICIARRTKKNRIKIKESLEHKLDKCGRNERLYLATEVALTHLARALKKKTELETNNKEKKKKIVAT